MPSDKPSLKVDDLVVRFPIRQRGEQRYITPVDHVSFEIKPGEVLSLVGESGSGKSTLGRALVRLIEPSKGSICIGNNDVTHIRRSTELRGLRKNIQMVFQDPFASLNPVRTIGQHLKILVRKHQGLRGRQLEQRVIQLLDTVGLYPGQEVMVKYPHEMSGGQRQRVAIARALTVNPSFLVADEPISMLDVSIRADILKLLKRLKSDFDLGYLYITHDLASAKYFGDKIMVMYGGQVMETGTSKEIVDNAVHPYTRLLLASTAGSPRRERVGETSLEAPDLFEGRRGCPFAHRCPFVSDVCRTEKPPLVEQVHGHAVACHHPVLGGGNRRHDEE